MSLRGSMLASVAGQKPRCPQFVGIAKFLRLPARQRHQPCLGLGSDRRLSTGARAIIQRSQRAFGHGALDAALDRLMMQPECPADRKKRGVFSIGQQYPRPLHPARRFSARLRYRSQLRRISFSKRQLNRPPPRCHDFSSRSLVGTRDEQGGSRPARSLRALSQRNMRYCAPTATPTDAGGSLIVLNRGSLWLEFAACTQLSSLVRSQVPILQSRSVSSTPKPHLHARRVSCQQVSDTKKCDLLQRAHASNAKSRCNYWDPS